MTRANWKTYGLLAVAVFLVVVFVLTWSELSKPLHSQLAVVDLSSGVPAADLPSQAQLQTLQRTADAEMLIAGASLLGLLVVAALLVRIVVKRLKTGAEPDLSDVF